MINIDEYIKFQRSLKKIVEYIAVELEFEYDNIEYDFDIEEGYVVCAVFYRRFRGEYECYHDISLTKNDILCPAGYINKKRLEMKGQLCLN